MIGPLWAWSRDMPECARVAFAGVQNFVENRWPQTSLKCQKWTRYWFRYGNSQAKCIAFHSWPSICYFQSIEPINIFYTNNHNDTATTTPIPKSAGHWTLVKHKMSFSEPGGAPRPSICRLSGSLDSVTFPLTFPNVLLKLSTWGEKQ